MQDRKNFILELQKQLVYEFSDILLIIQALTTKSFTNENKEHEYQNEISLIGDSIIRIFWVNHLRSKSNNTGVITNEIRYYISKPAQGFIMKTVFNTIYHTTDSKSFISKVLRLGRGETIGPRLISETFEAIIGSIYLDSNFENALKRTENIFIANFKTLEILKSQLKEIKI